MPLNIDTFRNIANSTLFSSRDLAVQGQGETATARLGNFVFSQDAKTNDLLLDRRRVRRLEQRLQLVAHRRRCVCGRVSVRLHFR